MKSLGFEQRTHQRQGECLSKRETNWRKNARRRVKTEIVLAWLAKVLSIALWRALVVEMKCGVGGGEVHEKGEIPMFYERDNASQVE
ncbi:hypothetical protein VIGAN_04081000 [Vigna angularis var. angularis]|uniref:Uncharacterized protein n=1 Tax=Vigna angularis var. angularis TaxID=157739 RepID=A0A0S3RT54_PHAAN|nr:hypothetical protein VIGAN_04081000 [Vigna angularis var. angularis]